MKLMWKSSKRNNENSEKRNEIMKAVMAGMVIISERKKWIIGRKNVSGNDGENNNRS